MFGERAMKLELIGDWLSYNWLFARVSRANNLLDGIALQEELKDNCSSNFMITLSLRVLHSLLMKGNWTAWRLVITNSLVVTS
ncbi:hypothetical protein TIFTF001_040661 [Ficus carica]|uniref:Uncharacterized protein n=1 Tax=Ficus carica TaxID=3494 RepID=A0AA88CPS1_FICCA|nr:hypothetical protein TIFTF001_040661 [Ficus carica]